MNKIRIAFLIAFSVAFVGCKKEAVVPDPEIVIFNVLHGTSFTTEDEITVIFEAKNAAYSENNIGAPTTTSWVYTFTANLNITNIKVSAFNTTGVKVEKSANITVAPSAKDSLAAHGWKLKSKEFWKISTNTIISRFDLSAEQLLDVRFYTADGYCNVYHAGQTTSFAGWRYTLIGKILTNGDQICTITKLTDSELQYEEVYKYGDDQKIVFSFKATP